MDGDDGLPAFVGGFHRRGGLTADGGCPRGAVQERMQQRQQAPPQVKLMPDWCGRGGGGWGHGG